MSKNIKTFNRKIISTLIVLSSLIYSTGCNNNVKSSLDNKGEDTKNSLDYIQNLYKKVENIEDEDRLKRISDENNSEVTLTNLYVKHFDINFEKTPKGSYDPNQKEYCDFRLCVLPYKVIDGSVVVIKDIVSSSGEMSGGLINSLPGSKTLVNTPVIVEIQIPVKLKDKVKDIYPVIRLSNEVMGNGDISFPTTEISTKVKLIGINIVRLNGFVEEREFEFELIDITEVKKVESENRKKFEELYDFDEVKWRQSVNDIIKLSDVELNSTYLKPKKGKISSEVHSDTIIEQHTKKYYNGCGYSYESKEDCLNQCGKFNEGQCNEGEQIGEIVKSSKKE